MLHAALLAAALSSTAGNASAQTQASAPVRQCLESMDGAVYHGDPTDRKLMKSNVAACNAGVAVITKTVAPSERGAEKLFITARILDRAATLSFMGLGDADAALADVKKANLYFRIASGLPTESADYRAAALANVQLTSIQLQTLRSEMISTVKARATVALHVTHSKHIGE